MSVTNSSNPDSGGNFLADSSRVERKLASACERVAGRLCVLPFFGLLHRHGHDGSGVQIHCVLMFADRVRAPVLHLGDALVGVGAADPLGVRDSVECSGVCCFSPMPRTLRRRSESAARHAIPRSKRIPAKYQTSRRRTPPRRNRWPPHRSYTRARRLSRSRHRVCGRTHFQNQLSKMAL